MKRPTPTIAKRSKKPLRIEMKLRKHLPKSFRNCAYPNCRVRFKQNRPLQKYHSARCRRADWERIHPRLDPIEKKVAK